MSEKEDSELCDAIAELGNMAFEKGRNGKNSIFFDEDKEIAALEEATGITPTAEEKQLVHAIFKMCRKAYRQGQKESEVHGR